MAWLSKTRTRAVSACLPARPRSNRVFCHSMLHVVSRRGTYTVTLVSAQCFQRLMAEARGAISSGTCSHQSTSASRSPESRYFLAVSKCTQLKLITVQQFQYHPTRVNHQMAGNEMLQYMKTVSLHVADQRLPESLPAESFISTHSTQHLGNAALSTSLKSATHHWDQCVEAKTILEVQMACTPSCNLARRPGPLGIRLRVRDYGPTFPGPGPATRNPGPPLLRCLAISKVSASRSLDRTLNHLKPGINLPCTRLIKSRL